MGFSFHYSGRIENPDRLAEIVEEIGDICEVNNWKYFVFDRQFPENTIGKTDHNQKLYGICFTPPECEMVSISFLSNGRMSSAAGLQFWGNSGDPKEKEYLYMISVKTQFAGIDMHIRIMHLFRYLSAKYFVDFTMIDEGGYWETNNESLLRKNYKIYTELLDGFTSALEDNPIQDGEDKESYILRLAKRFQDLRKKDE